MDKIAHVEKWPSRCGIKCINSLCRRGFRLNYIDNQARILFLATMDEISFMCDKAKQVPLASVFEPISLADMGIVIIEIKYRKKQGVGL